MHESIYIGTWNQDGSDSCHTFCSYLRKQNQRQSQGTVLGMEYHWDDRAGTMELSFQAKEEQLFKMAGLEHDCHPVYTPALDHPLPVLETVQSHPDYRAVVGLLLHLTKVRFEICNAVRELCRHGTRNNAEHWNAVLRVVRYLKTTAARTKVFRRNFDRQAQTQMAIFVDGAHRDSFDIDGHSVYCQYDDASHAGDRTTKRGVSGRVEVLAGNVFAVKSKMQTINTQSSCESEVIAQDEGARDILFYRRILDELGCIQQGATKIFTDSQSAIAMLHRPMMSSRSKHMDIRRLTVRQLMDEGVVELAWVPASLQLADCGTKNLGRVLFDQFRDYTSGIKLVCSEFQGHSLACYNAAQLVKEGCQYSNMLPSYYSRELPKY